MSRLPAAAYWLLALALACLAAPFAQTQGAAPTVILISFDGWRWDYQQRYRAPNLQRLIDRGVRAEALIPSFPSKTFPNHYTLVTGLYPGHHGIVSNNIRDPQTGRRFSMSNRREVQDTMWWGGEPIWNTLQKAGGRASATFWPGSEAPIQGMRPHFWEPFHEAVPGAARVDRVLRRLDLPPNERPRFFTLYFSDVDAAAHASGPDSGAVRAAVGRVDGFLGRLLNGLAARGLLDTVNIVVTSDHGLAETSSSRVVVLDDYIALDDVDIIDLNPALGLFPRAGREAVVLSALERAHPQLRVYRRRQSPEHWHYRDHPRIPPVVGVVAEGWQLLRRGTLVERLARRIGSRGEHGYDAREARSMHGLFVAAGPAFKQRTAVDAFENVHVYNALAAALRLQPAPNDGDPAIARMLLRP